MPRGETAAAVSPGANPSGAIAAAVAGQGHGVLAQLDGPTRRRRGAQPQNRNAWRHGHRSRVAEQRRAETAATMKAAGLILSRLGLLGDYRHRPRPIRQDQLPHLGAEAVALLQRLGLS
jgi:hypothetical protein